MPKNSELDDFLKQYPDTTHVDVLIMDLCGNAFGKRLRISAIESLYKSGTPVCAAMQLVNVLGESADPMGYGFSNGDPDGYARPIPGTLAAVPWAGKGRCQVLCQLLDGETQQPQWFDPRVILENVVARFEELKLKPVVAVELEFFLIETGRDESGHPIPVSSPRTGLPETQGRVLSLDKLDEFAPILDAIEQACAIQNIPTTSMISENGAGQFEINLTHQHNPVAAADHGALLRRAVQGVVRSQGIDTTFMSKPFAEESGNGLHVHISLEDDSGNNVFNPNNKNGNDLIGHAAAGMGATMAESMAIFAPNLNVYRRFKPDEFVPVTKDWGENNRSVAFRIPPSDDANRRLEHRVSGAEANPYLVMAAVLAGVHHGLANKLLPGEKATGNAGAVVDNEIPFTFWDGLNAIENAKILPEYFGVDYPNLYSQVKRAEFETLMDPISSREFELYL